LLETVRRRVAGASITGIAAGLHALLQLPNGQTEDDVVGAPPHTASPWKV
jgi:hypothetical protein